MFCGRLRLFSRGQGRCMIGGLGGGISLEVVLLGVPGYSTGTPS